MRLYQFAKIAARAFPTKSDLNNKWIYYPDTVVVVNVSQKEDKEVQEEIIKRGADYYHFPLQEEVADIGWGNVLKAVSILLKYDKMKKPMFVHCDCGNHRSRLVIEAFHFAKFGVHFFDEYKGFDNHLIYDSETGHLPQLKEIELNLREIQISH